CLEGCAAPPRDGVMARAPSAAKRTVQRHRCPQEGGIGGGELALDGELLALGVENGEEVAHTADVELTRHLDATLGGGEAGLELAAALSGTVAGDKGVLRLFEGGKHILFIRTEGLLQLRVARRNLGTDPAVVENGQRDGGSEREEIAAAQSEVGE